uniref:Uncharacterized protein n=1 Tax=Caenorhabditis japonica TaxID=281687 RepID=A0A8R1EUS8_CAEJA
MCNMVFKMVWGIGIDKMKEKKICSSTKAGTPSEWQNIFVGCAISLIISGTIFLMFGSGEVQEWAKIKEDVEMKENVMTEEEKLNEISARVIQEESLCV